MYCWFQSWRFIATWFISMSLVYVFCYDLCNLSILGMKFGSAYDKKMNLSLHLNDGEVYVWYTPARLSMDQTQLTKPPNPTRPKGFRAGWMVVRVSSGSNTWVSSLTWPVQSLKKKKKKELPHFLSLEDLLLAIFSFFFFVFSCGKVWSSTKWRILYEKNWNNILIS